MITVFAWLSGHLQFNRPISRPKEGAPVNAVASRRAPTTEPVDRTPRVFSAPYLVVLEGGQAVPTGRPGYVVCPRHRFDRRQRVSS